MITYQTFDTNFSFKGRRFTSSWLRQVVQTEKRMIGDIGIQFCSDEHILSVNKEFLHHDYYTDVITFDYCEGDVISGDLVISVDSVADNASHFHTEFEEELNRVIVHGVLHLLGYDDHTLEDQKVMREKENFYLEVRHKLLCDAGK